MTFKSWFLGLSDNEKVAFFGVIGCGIGGLLLWAGQLGWGFGFLFGGFIGILFLGNSES
jgi:hypothetical protein